jgi:hypothetical protein
MPWHMTNHRNRFPARRKFLKQSAALSAGAATLAAPAIIAQTLVDPASVDTPVDPTAVRAPAPASGAPAKDGSQRPAPRAPGSATTATPGASST